MNSTNFTTSEDFERRNLAELLVFGLSILAIALTGIFGNLATLVVIFTNERLSEQVSSYFIAGLAALDLITSSTVILPAAIAVFADGWIFGKTLCDLHGLFSYSTVMTTSCMIGLISFDRAVAIRYPFRYPQIISKTRGHFLNYGTLLYGGVGGVYPTVMDWFDYDYVNLNCGIRPTAPVLAPALYAVTCYSIYYLVPQTVIFLSTGYIIRSAKKSEKNMQSVQDSGKSSGGSEKLITSLMFLVICYEISIGPWGTFRVYKIVFKKEFEPKILVTLSGMLLYMGSAVNPFIYAIFRKDFQSAFKTLFRVISNRIMPA